MGNSNRNSQDTQYPLPLDLVQFRKRIRAGDLILIGSRTTIESDISIPPQLWHRIEFTLKNKFSISHKIDLPVWNTAAIVVDMSLHPNSGKSLLELTPDGFVLSEFISRMIEIKKKNYDISARFIEGDVGDYFRHNLITLAEFLAGKSIDELSDTPIYNEVRLPVSSYLNNTERESKLYDQLKEAFYMVVTDADDLTITKSQLHELMREFTGTNMDLTVDELAEQLGVEGNIDYLEFSKRWAQGPGRTLLSEELHEDTLLAGQFLKYCYKTLGVIYEQEPRISTPDDFATNKFYSGRLKNENLVLINSFSFTTQVQIIL